MRIFPGTRPLPRSPRRSTVAGLPVLFVTMAILGCGDRDGLAGGGAADGAANGAASARASTGMTGAPQAISLMGEELYALPQDSAAAARLEARIEEAEAEYAANPDDPDALIWLGRHYGYAGRYQEAIDLFSEGIERFPDDARFYRHRGHRFITVRKLERAVEDLDHAARLTSGREDVVEPDGMPNDAGIPRSTLQTNIWYHLGLARYLQGDFEAAVHAFTHGLEISPNDDMRVAMADWLWMALRRLGRDAAADSVIAFVQPEMEILENDAYHRRLLLYRGLLPLDSIAPALMAAEDTVLSDDRALQLATSGYGLGSWFLIEGDRARARTIFEDVLATGYWPAFGYIAAEAELARWDDPGSTP